MALLAGFSPQEFFGVGNAFCYPLRWRQNSNFRWQRFARQITFRFTSNADFRRMRRDVILEFPYKESMHDIRLVVRDTLVKLFIERQQMTLGTRGGEFWRKHGFATGRWLRSLEHISKRNRANFRQVSRCGEAVGTVFVGPRHVYACRAVAIGALQLNDRAIRTLADGFHVDGVIQENGAGILCAVAEYSEFRVAVGEAFNISGVVQLTLCNAQVGVAFGAGLIASGGKLDPATMFHVAGGTGGDGGGDLVFVVGRAVVAGEAGGVGGGGGELAGLGNMAGGALFFEDGVWGAHASAGVDAGIAGKAVKGEPDEGERGHEDGEQQLGALEGRGALEIVQVDALREFFSCACACQRLPQTRAKPKRDSSLRSE